MIKVGTKNQTVIEIVGFDYIRAIRPVNRILISREWTLVAADDEAARWLD